MKGAGNVVVVQNRFGRQLIRKKRHVKPIRYSPTQKEKTELKNFISKIDEQQDDMQTHTD